MKQVLHVVDARDLAHLALDALDLFDIFDLPAQDHDPAVGVDADLSLGKRPVAKQLALHFAHETDIVDLRWALLTVRDRVREPDDLARLVMGLALDPPGAAAEHGLEGVSSSV